MPALELGKKRGFQARLPLGLAFLTLIFTGACAPMGTTIAEDSATVDGGGRGPRGRVEVVNGALVTDRGSNLRGVTVGPDVGLDFGLQDEPELMRPLIRKFFDRMALEAGLDAIHVYVENEQTEVGSGAGFGDLLVDEADRAGLYLVLGFGSGTELGSFDAPHTRAFWDYYAPRYAARTHVLYELHNAPERTCNAPFDAATMTFEVEQYQAIRTQAPDTHVVLMSYISTPTDAMLSVGASTLALGGVNFANASIGFHAVSGVSGCPPVSDLATLVVPTNVALLATELPPDAADWPEATTLVEARGMGWMSFHWLRFNSNLDDLVAMHDEAQISWCPDFGTWPEDSATCGN